MTEPATRTTDHDAALDAEEQRMRDDAEAERRAQLPLEVSMFDSIEAAAAAWRGLEQRAILTPYQRYDWITAFAEAQGATGGRTAIALVSDDEGPVALLPLVVMTRFGLKLGTLIGSEIANADWMPVLPSAAGRFDRHTLDGLLAEIGRRTGMDALSLRALPAAWQGVANPLLAYPHQPGPDHLFLAALDDGNPTRINTKRMRNIMRGKRRLEESMGPVRLRTANTPEDMAAFHRVFLAQREARFAEQGIANVFADRKFVRFFELAASRSLGSERPALRFHALEAGGEIVATSCGSYSGTHFSQYINSMTTGPAAKSSLMALLMNELIEQLRADGIVSLDMGLGDFDYKLDWTDRTVVYDAVIPLTLKGRLGAAAILAARRLRRAIKQNDRLFGSYKRLRRLLGSGRAG